MRTAYVRRDHVVVAALALLLLIDLLAEPWFSLPSVSISGIMISIASPTATGAPDGWLGVLAVLAVLAILADLGLEVFSPETKVPMIAGSRTMTRYVLGVAAAAFIGLKFLLHLSHFGNLGIGFWFGAILVTGLVVFTAEARHGSPLQAVPVPPPAGTPAGPMAAEPTAAAAEANPAATAEAERKAEEPEPTAEPEDEATEAGPAAEPEDKSTEAERDAESTAEPGAEPQDQPPAEPPAAE